MNFCNEPPQTNNVQPSFAAQKKNIFFSARETHRFFRKRSGRGRLHLGLAYSLNVVGAQDFFNNNI
jgi:hypothetical protein